MPKIILSILPLIILPRFLHIPLPIFSLPCEIGLMTGLNKTVIPPFSWELGYTYPESSEVGIPEQTSDFVS